MWEIWTREDGLESYTNETIAERRIAQLKARGRKVKVNFVNC